ncbi:hypothetical protein VCRLGP8_610197 [Vibrio crassostreae]|nr:hypothetical protein VCRLGP7_1210198 [Vibrio crassostreae]CDT40309.1 hypothetical protein VCR20J5_280118 [Vibrio crassostreae]CDT53084.1 hypothetical protein VCRLGP107_700228 [Vibrio crassostreae]CDT53941.1 hypothetical protein VCR15J5_670121 [Vibrio crassostreae]CDT67556.1 hypothetical protein VCRLGP8_610197 [Vibrio crassostreae]
MCLVASAILTDVEPFNTKDTVDCDTPAAAAMSLMVTFLAIVHLVGNSLN